MLPGSTGPAFGYSFVEVAGIIAKSMGWMAASSLIKIIAAASSLIFEALAAVFVCFIIGERRSEFSG
jgi:hypothetical protein